MKVYLIKASSGSEFSKYKAKTGGPPQNIFSTAACTPSHFDIDMCDETIGMEVNFKSSAEVVAIFMSTPDALRAYEIADKFRSSGKTIVLGGLHTKFMQDEAAQHADTLLIGEVEGIWEELLEDVIKGNLKEKYERTEALDLSMLKAYPSNIIPVSKYNYTWSVVVSRGCIHNCDFCLVPRFSESYRYRPIENIVEEVKQLKKLGVEWVELHSDTLTANRKYIIDLLKALAPLNMNFYGETTIMIAKDLELLRVAQKAGLKALLFGIETPSLEALKEQGKGFVKPENIKNYIQTIKQHGIQVWGDFLFGFDAHDTSIFKSTLEFIKDIGVDEAFPHLIIPFPGSETYRRLDKENRILTNDWSKYEGSNAVFQPQKMTNIELEQGLLWVWEKLYYKTGGKEPKFKINPETSTKRHIFRNSLTHWRSILALLLIGGGILFNIYWIWGLFFLFWAINDIKNKTTYLLEEVSRKRSPVLYWIIVLMWLLLSLWSLSSIPIDSILQTDISNNKIEIIKGLSENITIENKKEVQNIATYNQAKSLSHLDQVVNPNEDNQETIIESEGILEDNIEMKDDEVKTDSTTQVKNKHFGSTLSLPSSWEYQESKGALSYTLSASNEDESGYFLLTGYDYQGRHKLEKHVNYMEEEFSKEIPEICFKDFEESISNKNTIDRIYRGDFNNYPLTCHVSYFMYNNYAYTILGIYANSDLETAEIISQIFASFSLQ